ncbi:MAG: hypothetical protein KatS3mg094_116 [Candidatus Parcubacteria bacterium]|nr:MAG: hypothetical protein KatS3mg094_116 [Candidatus Parcubacteria bacterium]
MIISLLLSLIFFLVIGINFLRLVQIKDYFFPSILAYFDYPSNYRHFFRLYELILIIIWLFLIFFSFKNGKIYINENILLLILLIFGILIYLRKDQIKKIRWNLKGLFIFYLTTLINYRILSATNNDLTIVIILLTSAIQFSIVIFSTFIANIITKVYAEYLFKITKNKISKWLKKDKNRLVIGISGSYGKTSTKEILSQLLEEKFKVLKSPLRLNAEIGLAKFILKSQLKNYDILVLELGSRKLGEISKMVDIFQPKCVFLTGLGPQHIATFGSFENMIKGETEIFKKIDDSGIAFLNIKDRWIKEYEKKLNIKNKYLYGDKDGNFYFKEEILTLDGSEFIFVYPEGEEKLFTNIVGNQFLENLCGALGLCYILGIQPYQLKEKLKNLKLLSNQFEIVKRANPLIINDSYNANLIGVQRGIEFFNKIFKGKKILFFGGILELGEETEKIYQQLIEYFKIFDLIILTFNDFSEIFLKNIENEKILIYDNQELDKIIKFYDLNDLGLLILGRIPEKLLNRIKEL